MTPEQERVATKVLDKAQELNALLTECATHSVVVELDVQDVTRIGTVKEYRLECRVSIPFERGAGT